MILREKDRRRIEEIARSVFTSPLEIWAYGSRVNGDAHSASDLDLVIRGEKLQSVNIDELIEFKRLLKESNIPIFVQVLDWARIPNSFHQSILKNYKIFIIL